MEATELFPNPYDASETYYSFWQRWTANATGNPDASSAVPEVPVPGSGSDHAAFIFYLGVPVFHIGFWPDTFK